MADRYEAALAMAQWADQLGAYAVSLSEHHGSADGYLPSPIAMAAAVAARTTTTRISIQAIPAPFHDPLRLAEDLAVVDLLSRGRLDVTLAGGYVLEEFAMFATSLSERPRRVVEAVRTLKQAWTGLPFEHEGRTVRVTPAPHRRGGPRITLGGSSEAAARRAARIADGFMPTDERYWQHYVDECIALGKADPGAFLGGDTAVVFVADDPERSWERLGPYFLHETNAYGAWQAATGVHTGFLSSPNLEALRASGAYRILTPDQLVAEVQAAEPFGFVLLNPMVGGVPPDLAWEHLELFEHRVLPRLGPET